VGHLALADDRTAVLAALQVLVRLAATLDNDAALAGLDVAVLTRVLALALTDDAPLAHGALEFLARYTGVGPETAARVALAGAPGVVPMLMALMTSGGHGTNSFVFLCALLSY
jgi:hypothetical protein